jgi:N-methylhydantoinase B/oxoprolinase/acetone carboxylase alpha subunit
MLLSRLQMDCNYFLGNGNRYEKHLWAGNVDDHIEMMKKIWNGFEEKPEWLSMEQIEDYERKMKNNDTNNDIDGMKINESQLRKIIKESFKKVLNEYNSTFMSSTERAAQEFIDAFDSNEPEKSDFKTMERAMNHMSAYDFVGVDRYEMDEIREINKTLEN